MASAWQYSAILGLFGVLCAWLRPPAQAPPEGAAGGDQGQAPHEAVVAVVNGQAITAQGLLEHVRGDILAMAGQMRLQDLSRKLQEAHELHDEAGQLLASVHLALETTISGLPPHLREGFHQVRSHLDAIETQLRGLAHELRPTILDDLGLLPALQGLVQRVAERTRLHIRVDSAL